MSVDCLSMVGEKEFARRSMWEATLRDANGDVPWSTGLIKSVTVPKVSLDVAEIYGGTTRAYNGWKLPSNISLSIWETSDHTVERYLDEWMFGKPGKKGTGILNIDGGDAGALQAVPNEGVIYRELVFKTFIYETESASGVDVLKKSFAQELKFNIDKMEGFVKDMAKEDSIDGGAREPLYADIREGAREMRGLVARTSQLMRGATVPVVMKAQAIPILDKLAQAASDLANQLVARVPAPSNLTRRFIPPVIIPPPVMRIPVTAQIAPPRDSRLDTARRLVNQIPAKETKSRTMLIENALHHIEKLKAAVSKSPALARDKAGEPDGMDSAKVSLGDVKRSARQKITSSVTYQVALSDYDVGGYSYESGEGVSYTVSLAVRDMKRTEYPD